MNGQKIGPYEVVVKLGEGGMGEVYRARDTRLQREVALKMLPESVAADPERLARFTREAQLLAALNHPSIGAIHGLEESGGTPVLVLELVEGPTLADRIEQGPIEPAEAVAIARQVAEAVEFAHEQGIIHRDLKPANIKLRPDGVVKVLDFGLAKALSAPGVVSGASPVLAQSPTLTNPATAAGLVLGTAAYLSPEQARGGTVDRRADIWAFGLMLFEMLAGRRPFGGGTISETMAAILRDEPDWTALPASTPGPLRRLLRRTLEKDPRRRLRDMGDARLILEDIQSGAETDSPAAAARRTAAWRQALPWGLAILSLAVAGVVLLQRQRARPSELPTLKYSLAIPNLQLERTILPTLSPDGKRVAFGRDGQLWVRDFDKLDAHPLTGVTGALYPFWSHDSQQVAYLTGTALWRVALDGSAPVRIASSRFSRGGRTPGGVWLRDGTIVFAPSATGSGLVAVSAEGGEFRQYLANDPKVEGDFHRPSLLPDGQSFLMIVDRLDTGADTIAVVTGQTRKTILRLNGEFLDSPAYSPTGHVLYHRETTTPGIWAVPFSFERLEATGSPFLVVPQGSWPAVGANGTLVYADRELTGVEELVWFDMASGTVSTALTEGFPNISYPRLSPDGTRVAAVARSVEATTDIVVADLLRHTSTKIAEGATPNSRPAWRDNRTLVYSIRGAGRDRLMVRPADASQNAVELFDGMEPAIGRQPRLFFVRLSSGLGGGLWQAALPADGAVPKDPSQILQTPEHEFGPMPSPDGTLLAYSRGNPGQSEVMLRRFPEASGQWQVSVEGGSLPVWSPAGDKLYFRNSIGLIYVVDIFNKPEITLSAPRLVPRPTSLISPAGFDISPDGKRLLMKREGTNDPQRGPALTVVQNWFAEFRKDRR